jgi:hypothetical protein
MPRISCKQHELTELGWFQEIIKTNVVTVPMKAPSLSPIKFHLLGEQNTRSVVINKYFLLNLKYISMHRPHEGRDMILMVK